MMQSPFHSPMFNLFSGDSGITPAPLAGNFGMLGYRHRDHAGTQRLMPYAPFGVQGQPQGGYDSSGINPHGMYNGTFGQPQFPQSSYPQFPRNPGGFLAPMFRRG